MSQHHLGLRAAAVVVQRLNFDLVRHVGGRSRHDELGGVARGCGGPFLVHTLLSPLDPVLKAWPVGLQTGQWLYRTQGLFLFYLSQPSMKTNAESDLDEF